MEVWETERRLKPHYTVSQSEKQRLNLSRDLGMFLDNVETEERALVKRALQKALEMLPQKQREYLMLYLVDGMTMVEIGELKGLHKSTISRTIKRARVNLFRYLQFTSVRFIEDKELVERLSRARGRK